MKKDQQSNTEYSSHFSDLELELRKLQPSMPESLRIRQDEIHFQLGYQTGKEYARKWQYSACILALVTITSWMAPEMLNKQQTADMTKSRSAEMEQEIIENKNFAEKPNVRYSEFNGKSETESATVPENPNTKAIPDHSVQSPSALNLFVLMQRLNTPEVSHSTGAYSEYRERVMIIGTDALPEFKMASNNDLKKDSDSQDDPDAYTKFKSVKWSSILF